MPLMNRFTKITIDIALPLTPTGKIYNTTQRQQREKKTAGRGGRNDTNILGYLAANTRVVVSSKNTLDTIILGGDVFMY